VREATEKIYSRLLTRPDLNKNRCRMRGLLTAGYKYTSEEPVTSLWDFLRK